MLRYLTDFRDAAACRVLLENISRLAEGIRPLNFMEFCGSHTHALMRYGLRQALPANVRTLSGPGCPVCVTAPGDIDQAISLAGHDGVLMATFGDMLRVPGSDGSLQEARARGADVRVVYSVTDALSLAATNPDRQVVFLGIGFETTAPGVAVAIEQAKRDELRNFSIISLHKLTPPAMRAILNLGEVRLDGIIGPGHVTTIIGDDAWRFLPEQYGIGCVVSGFEPVDMLLGLLELVRMTADGKPKVANCYKRSVRATGNRQAQAVLARVFTEAEADWRGLGTVPASGLTLRPEYADFDARQRFLLPRAKAEEPDGCSCGDILRGVLEPEQCPLFASVCTPESPVGPCMVSSEGACAAHFQYGGRVV